MTPCCEVQQHGELVLRTLRVDMIYPGTRNRRTYKIANLIDKEIVKFLWGALLRKGEEIAIVTNPLKNRFARASEALCRSASGRDQTRARLPQSLGTQNHHPDVELSI